MDLAAAARPTEGLHRSEFEDSRLSGPLFGAFVGVCAVLHRPLGQAAFPWDQMAVLRTRPGVPLLITPASHHRGRQVATNCGRSRGVRRIEHLWRSSRNG